MQESTCDHPFFHGECVNLTIWQQQFQLSNWPSLVFFSEEQLQPSFLPRVTFRTATFSKELLFFGVFTLSLIVFLLGTATT